MATCSAPAVTRSFPAGQSRRVLLQVLRESGSPRWRLADHTGLFLGHDPWSQAGLWAFPHRLLHLQPCQLLPGGE